MTDGGEGTLEHTEAGDESAGPEAAPTGTEKSALEFDWAERIEAASGDPTALHHLSLAWSEVAAIEGRAISQDMATLVQMRDRALEALRTRKQHLATVVGAGHLVGGSKLLRRLYRGRLARLQVADAKLRSDYREIYDRLTSATEDGLREGTAWRGHVERGEAQGQELLGRLDETDSARANVHEALGVLEPAHRRLDEGLERLAEPMPEWLKP